VTRRTLFLMGVAGAIAGCRRDQRPRLNVFNWSAYVAEDTIPNFEREFNVRVRYAIYESNEEMLARVMSGNSGWDVAFPSNYFIEPMREFGLLAHLDHARLGNLHNLDTPFQRPSWDASLEWSMPYMWNASGIVYSGKLTPAPRAWSDMWQPKLAGHITMLDDPFDVFGACLKKLGYSINTSNPDELRKAQQQAIEQKRLLRAYLNAEVRDQIVSGDVLAAQLWSTTAQQAIDAAPTIGFCFPSEGYAIYPDCAVILRESKRIELAHEFLNYLLRPKVAADIVVAARSATANAAARSLLPEAIRNNAVLFPPVDVLARGEWAQTSRPEIQRLRDRLWTEVKSS
jgi:spermidine/putrescine transport system substrate-binding protein